MFVASLAFVAPGVQWHHEFLTELGIHSCLLEHSDLDNAADSCKIGTTVHGSNLASTSLLAVFTGCTAIIFHHRRFRGCDLGCLHTGCLLRHALLVELECYYVSDYYGILDHDESHGPGNSLARGLIWDFLRHGVQQLSTSISNARDRRRIYFDEKSGDDVCYL